MIGRIIEPAIQKAKKSVLLIGPRQVGKSTLMRSLKPDLEINLADENEYFSFLSNPNELRSRIESVGAKTVFIDEVQRIVSLLNTVQALIDEPSGKSSIKFFLTGSSARKLRRGHANLLPGRLVQYFLGPLVSAEMNYQADTNAWLKFGCLPGIFLERDALTQKEVLKSYATVYLQQEIRAEALVRQLDSFARSIPVAMQHSGQFLDYSKLAKLAKVSRQAITRFFEIYEDTLLGHRLWPAPAYLEKADLVKHPKFFVFDPGIYNAFSNSFELANDRKGIVFEHLLFSQLLHSAWAARKSLQINTFRTRAGLEIDFLLDLEGKTIGVEAKAHDHPNEDDVAPLREAQKSYLGETSEIFVAHLGQKEIKRSGVWCLPWQKLLAQLGL